MIPDSIRTGQYCRISERITLHYASCGEPDRPLVLFIHGFPEFWQAWRDVLPLIGGDYYAVAPDLRGFNLSSKPDGVESYKAKELVNDLVGLIAALGRRKCVVVAHDWGGAVAWSLAIARPDLIEKLVILNAPHPVPFARALTHDPVQQASSQYMNWLRRPGSEGPLSADNFARLERFFHVEAGAPWFNDELKAAYRDAWSQPGAMTGSINYYRASPLYPPFEGDPGASRLTLREEDFVVRVPTLVIWGDGDIALRPILLEGLEKVVPDLRIVHIEGATHWLAHEQPQQVAALIREFIANDA